MKKSSRAKSKARPARKAKPVKTAAKPTARPSAKRAPPKDDALAKRMAAFSEKLLKEEEAPVAVRSFVEARAGSRGSSELLPKTGQVQPRLEPIMGGELAVPKARQDQEFRPNAPKKRKKLDTPETFGPVELRQATASGGKHVSTAKPENLQRGASRIGALASASPSGKGAKGRREVPEEFDVHQQTASGARRASESTTPPVASDLSDWGEIEIDQQTRSGSRKVGKLASSGSDEEESEEETDRT